jgi:hypothetical protein
LTKALNDNILRKLHHMMVLGGWLILAHFPLYHIVIIGCERECDVISITTQCEVINIITQGDSHNCYQSIQCSGPLLDRVHMNLYISNMWSITKGSVLDFKQPLIIISLFTFY